MNEKERELIKKLITNSISSRKFVKKILKKEDTIENYLYILLNEAFLEKNKEDVEYALIAGFILNSFTIKYTKLLCALLDEKWHYKHEDIVRILQFLRDEYSINYLYKTVLTKYEYLEFNNSYSLIVKCCWALGDINTQESKEKLELLARSDNEIIREAATEQLKRDIWK